MSKPLIDADIKKAATLPSPYYTDSSLFLKFFQSMNQNWQAIGHESQFQSVIHPLTHLEDIFQQPLIRTNFENKTSILSNHYYSLENSVLLKASDKTHHNRHGAAGMIIMTILFHVLWDGK